MGSFVHANDKIIINDEYVFSFELFQKLEPEYSLPNGFIYRKYVQGEKIHYIQSTSNEIAQKYNWDDGDRYISRLSELLYLKQHEEIEEQERKEHVLRVKEEENQARENLLEKKKTQARKLEERDRVRKNEHINNNPPSNQCNSCEERKRLLERKNKNR